MAIEKFENKSSIRYGNILFFILVVFTIMTFLFINASGGLAITDVLFLIGLLILYVYFMRVTSRIEIDSENCYLSVPPFLRIKYKIRKMTFINIKGLYFIKFNEPFYKIPFYMVILGGKEQFRLVKYIDDREDIIKKII